jgi:hypothetical protein
VQPPDTHAKRYTKKFGAHAVFLAPLWFLLRTTEDWPPTTFALNTTDVTRWWPPASASQRAEPVWVAFGKWQGSSRALWGLSICAFDFFIDSVGKFGSTAEYWKTLKALGIRFYQIYHYSRLAFCLFCALPPLVKISLRTHLLAAVALFMLCLGKNRAWWERKILNRALESTNYTHKNTGTGHSFRVPIPYLNPHISAESRRMKTTRRPYFKVTLRRFIFRSHKYFLLSSSPPTAMMASW